MGAPCGGGPCGEPGRPAAEDRYAGGDPGGIAHASAHADDMKGFVALPRHRVVERTFCWFGRNRRLAADFETLAESLIAYVAIASIQIALTPLARR